MLRFVFLLIPSIALAEPTTPTLEARMFAVCQDQQRAILTWHAGSEGQRAALQEQYDNLSKEVTALRAKIKEMERAKQ